MDNYFLFTGYEFDYELGDNYADFREQSPLLGRFFSPDPYDGSMNFTNPQSLKRYAYVLDNPTNLIDPFGLDCGQAPPDPPATGNFTVRVTVSAPCPDYSMRGLDGDGPHGLIYGTETNAEAGKDHMSATRGGTNASYYLLNLARIVHKCKLNVRSMAKRHWAVNRDYGPDTPESRMMMSAYGFSKNVANYLSGGPSSGNQNFGLRGLVSSGLNPTTQFVGSYQWSVSQNNGNLDISLTNSTTAWSFFYHAPGLDPNPPNRFDSVLNPSQHLHPMGRVNQTFHIRVKCS